MMTHGEARYGRFGSTTISALIASYDIPADVSRPTSRKDRTRQVALSVLLLHRNRDGLVGHNVGKRVWWRRWWLGEHMKPR